MPAITLGYQPLVQQLGEPIDKIKSLEFGVTDLLPPLRVYSQGECSTKPRFTQKQYASYCDIDIKANQTQVWPEYKVLKAALQNSHPETLLRVSFWNWGPTSDFEAAAMESGAVKDLLGRHVKLLLKYVTRWCTLQIDAPLLDFFLEHKLLHNILDVYYCRSPRHHHRPHWNPLRLSTLALKNLGLGRSIDLIALDEFLRCFPLRSLFIGDSMEGFDIQMALPCLQYRTMTHLKMSNFSVSALNILDLFVAAPNLEEGYFSDVTGPCPFSSHMPPAPCSNLRRLHLESNMDDFDKNTSQTTVSGLLGMVTTPVLEELVVCYETEWHSVAFDRFYAPEMKKLKLIGCCMTPYDMDLCLGRNPGIRELVLDTPVEHWLDPRLAVPYVFTEQVCAGLIFDSYRENKVPSLERLIIRDTCIEPSVYGYFARAVESRCKSGRLAEVIFIRTDTLGVTLGRSDHEMMSALLRTAPQLSIKHSYS